ncbi:MAG: AMP-binding protein [Panacagrimonas sp.]
MNTQSDWTPLDGLYRWEQEQPDAVYLTQPSKGSVREMTWAQVGIEVRRAAAFLKSLEFESGSRIALLARNSAYWFMADLAIWMAGHVSVPIYPSLNEETVRYILDHSEAKLLILGALDDWESMQGGVPRDLPILSLPGAPDLTQRAGTSEWSDMVSIMPPLLGRPRRSQDELATLVYTSGTTGKPKGVMLGFKSFALSSALLHQVLPLGPQDRMLSYLPLAHVFEGAAVFASSLRHGFQVFFNESLATFAADLRRARPTVFHSVPRLWLKFQLGVLAKLPQEKLAALLADPATAEPTRRQVLTSLGLQDTRLAVSGSAPLPPTLIDWYRTLGLELLEGLGMSEDFAYSHISRVGRARTGYVGEPMEGVERRTADNGELLIKSPACMLGYYKAPELSADAFTPDGYFRTGDLGEIDSEGRLRLTGRLKELFKTSKGKYVAPAPIENKLMHPKVEAVCVAGAGLGQPFALVMLSADAQRSADEHTTLEQELEALMLSVNSTLDPHEQLDFIVLVRDDWTIGNGFLTPTMKIKRTAIEKHYEAQIDGWVNSRRAVIWEE